MHFRTATLPLLLLTALLTASCATSSPPTPPVVVSPPTLPAPPNVAEPKPSGFFWQMVCDYKKSLQATLKVQVTECER